MIRVWELTNEWALLPVCLETVPDCVLVIQRVDVVVVAGLPTACSKFKLWVITSRDR